MVGMLSGDPESLLGCLFPFVSLMIRIPSSPIPFYSASALQGEARTMVDAPWWGDWEALQWEPISIPVLTAVEVLGELWCLWGRGRGRCDCVERSLPGSWEARFLPFTSCVIWGLGFYYPETMMSFLLRVKIKNIR